MSRKETVIATILLIIFGASMHFVRHELMFMVAAMIAAILLAKKWRGSRFVRDRCPLWMVVAVVVIVLTGFLTYHAPDWIVFADPG